MWFLAIHGRFLRRQLTVKYISSFTSKSVLTSVKWNTTFGARGTVHSKSTRFAGTGLANSASASDWFWRTSRPHLVKLNSATCGICGIRFLNYAKNRDCLSTLENGKAEGDISGRRSQKLCFMCVISLYVRSSSKLIQRSENRWALALDEKDISIRIFSPF